jgi:hypothetical protein
MEEWFINPSWDPSQNPVKLAVLNSYGLKQAEYLVANQEVYSPAPEAA